MGKGSRLTRRGIEKSAGNGLLTALTPEQKWWRIMSRLAQIQLGCSLLMQLSYVAFPAYNFSLALWCLLACTPSWSAKYTRLVPLHMIAISFSVLTDIIWMSLWISGRVFFDQFCNANAVSIVSCGGASDHFPGCSTNQFALFTLVLNLLAKVASIVSLQRIHAIKAATRTKHRSHVMSDRSDASNAPTSIEVKPVPESKEGKWEITVIPGNILWDNVILETSLRELWIVVWCLVLNETTTNASMESAKD